MKITFLGTGTSSGVPMIACSCPVCKSTNPKDKRLRSSILIEIEGKVFVIDSGPDFRQQLLRENVQQLDALILTHEHKDHISGMDDIRAFNFIQGREADVYATERVQTALKREFMYVFNGDDYPGIPKVKLHTIRNEPFNIDGIHIIPVEVLHYRMPVFGFRIGDFCYITDAKTISTEEKKKLLGLTVLVLNALRKEDHISHFTLEEAVQLSAELKPEKTYLTHISHQLGVHDDVNKELPSSVRCAFDGMKMEV